MVLKSGKLYLRTSRFSYHCSRMSQYSFDDGAFRTLTFLYRITTFANYFISFGPLNGRNSHERSENIHLAFSTLNSNSRFDMNQISDMPSDVDDIARFRFEIDSKSKTFDRFVWYTRKPSFNTLQTKTIHSSQH